MYLTNLGLLLPNFAIVVIQLIYKTNIISDTFPFHCTVGMDLFATIISLAYDIFLSCVYIGIFLKFYCFPTTAQQTAHQSSSLHFMAKRNAMAAIVSMITSCANYIILISLNNLQRGLVASSVAALVGFSLFF